jgi:hypothetical protein
MSYHNSSNSSSPSSPRKRVASTNAKNTPQNNTQRKAAPPGYHYMPDGSLMSDSQMGASQTYGNRPSMDKIYSSKVDLKGLSDDLTFIFYVTINTKGLKPLNKKLWCELTYDTIGPVDMIVTGIGDKKRMFLKFSKDYITSKVDDTILKLNKSDITLELFKNKMGVFGFNSVKGNRFGALLSHIKYFSPIDNNGAITKFPTQKYGKSHALQMILNSVNIKGKMLDASFDMDIVSEYGGQFSTTIGFRDGIDTSTRNNGGVERISKPKHIIVKGGDMTLQTTNLTLGSENMSEGVVRYDYKKQLTRQKINPDTLELFKSQAFVIENGSNTSVDLSDFNLGTNTDIEIPYNISRDINDGVIQESDKVFKRGKNIRPIDWVNEIRDNEVFSSTNKCLSLKFGTKAQLRAFGENLKSQQIGSIEQYPVMQTNGRLKNVKRVYSRISQWVERSTLNQFNDVRFTYDKEGQIEKILICPRKRSNIGIERAGRQNKLVTVGGEFLLNGAEYIGDYHIAEGSIPTTGKNPSHINKQELEPLFDRAPINDHSDTDFCFTTYGCNTSGYSGFTSGDTVVYDLNISASTYSKSVVIPTSTIYGEYKLPMIGDVTKKYRPYAFSQVYGNNLIFGDTPQDYMTYSAKTSGVYRFTYNSYVKIKYTDTKWCKYIEDTYPTGIVGVYPENNYEMKRLVNTSILNAGVGETQVAVADTNYVYHPGDLGKLGSGVKKFLLSVYLIKYSSGSTEGTILKEYKILRNDTDGVANNYLNLIVTDIDKTSSGFGSCVTSATSATTIFELNDEVNLDTGYINLIKGDSVRLMCEADWETTSKQIEGVSSLSLKLGTKYNATGKPIEIPWYRAIKASSEIINKELFFEQTKESKTFDMVVGGDTSKVTMPGKLFIVDNGSKVINIPEVNKSTFNKLNFIDSKGLDDRLTWDTKSNIPVNRWQKLIESNTIKDYTISGNKMCEFGEKGIFTFKIPKYNTEYQATCDYTFPQTTHSYVVVNDFKNINGKDFRHYIVITPDINIERPCTSNKPITSYDIINKSTPDKWRVVNVNKKITINGVEITIINHLNADKEDMNKSSTNSNTVTIGDKKDTVCRYYCKCADGARSSKTNQVTKIDPVFNTTKVMSDYKPSNCEECGRAAIDHCNSIGGCKPVVTNGCNKVVEDLVDDVDGRPKSNSFSCSRLKGCYSDTEGIFDTIESCNKNCKQKIKEGTHSMFGCSKGKCKPIKQGKWDTLEECIKFDNTCGKKNYNTNTNGSQDVNKLYSCSEGICFEDPNGTYTSLDSCVVSCKETYVEYKPPEVEIIEKAFLSPISDTEDVVDCKKGYYWCKTIGRCIPNKMECPKGGTGN